MDVDLFDESGGSIPRPAWQVVDAARHARLTGELRLDLETPVSVWLRDGEPYFAERATDGTLGVRLLVEGHITLPQLQRGTVTVNGVEHIGRMFDLEPTIDRAVVEVWVEQTTDLVLMAIADQRVERYVFTPYRRHPSGVDRWSAPTAGPTRRKGAPLPKANPLDPTQPLERHDDARTGGFARPTLAGAPAATSPDPSTQAAATDGATTASAAPATPAPVASPAPATITPVAVPNEAPPRVVAVPAPPAPPLVTAEQSRRTAPLPPIPISGMSPATPPTGPVEKSLWIAVDPDPTPVADAAPAPTPPSTTPGTTTPTGDVAAPATPAPAPLVPTLAPRPGEMLDPTPNTLVRHITAAVRDVVAQVDEPPTDRGAG